MLDEHSPAMASVDEAVRIIKGMQGVLQVFPLGEETREGVLQVERCIKSQMGMQVKNEGMEQCMKRQFVLCILKNGTFRPPPEPTVQLIADDGIVIGTEIIKGDHHKYKDRDDLIWLSEDFVLYKDARPKHQEYFFMPPVSFPELADELGFRNVVSCSPSPPGDMVIKNHHKIVDDPKNATILVGFDVAK
ncbi:MAG: hypothetical protein A4E32_01324 [Methanomassiliicoccales archaeon PtaU1.Bin124]|nr:MAG: hypothetical protein A4E32_01324 [Methanomassiliicoccales archaeon PtaU1.Bin124]